MEARDAPAAVCPSTTREAGATIPDTTTQSASSGFFMFVSSVRPGGRRFDAGRLEPRSTNPFHGGMTIVTLPDARAWQASRMSGRVSPASR